MDIKLKFNEKDFENFKSFEKSVKRQLGQNTYVGTDSLCVYFDYPPSLSAMLRPFPKYIQLEFELTSSMPGGK